MSSEAIYGTICTIFGMGFMLILEAIFGQVRDRFNRDKFTEPYPYLTRQFKRENDTHYSKGDIFNISEEETTLKIHVSFRVYDDYEDEFEALRKLCQLVWGEQCGTAAKYMEQIEKEAKEKTQRFNTINESSVTLLKCVQKAESERDEIREKWNLFVESMQNQLHQYEDFRTEEHSLDRIGTL